MAKANPHSKSNLSDRQQAVVKIHTDNPERSLQKTSIRQRWFIYLYSDDRIIRRANSRLTC